MRLPAGRLGWCYERTLTVDHAPTETARRAVSLQYAPKWRTVRLRHMMYVVGSGPAGVSCAMALLGKGARVTMLDTGLELEAATSDKLLALKRVSHDQWQRDDVSFLKVATSADTCGIPLKYAYGSDFPYRNPGVDWRLELDAVDTRPSFAKGGLSTVWGAAILPYRAEDIRDWPIGDDELAGHYRAVLNFMPLAGRRDRLEQLFPLHSTCHSPLTPSSQARELLEDLERASVELARTGLWFGASRLALWSRAQRESECCYCALCMYGCPYGVIYSSGDTLNELRQHPSFTYQRHVAVDRIAENGDSVTVFAQNVRTRQRLQFHGSRVFLACGVLPTTKILLGSLEAYDEPVLMQDSGYFLLPLLRFRRTPDASRERLHTLSQIFLEIVDATVCDQTVHLQVYTYNELYLSAVRNIFGAAFPLVRAPARLLLDRLLLIQGYLPSVYSPSIRAVLRRDPNSETGTLQLSPVPNQRTGPVLQRVARKLRQSRRHLRAVPLAPMLRQGKPGRGFHSGGTFPMRNSPGPLQSDLHGRPHGFARVHAVDSTIFPTVPATTITLTVMANAHRIGSGIQDY
jgi:choline dehydrogenase-like flavoprotein